MFIQWTGPGKSRCLQQRGIDLSLSTALGPRTRGPSKDGPQLEASLLTRNGVFFFFLEQRGRFLSFPRTS